MSLMLDRSLLLLPLLPSILLALGLCGILAMYFSLKRQIAVQARRNQRAEALLQRLREAASSHTPQAVEPPLSEAPRLVATPPRSGMNLNRRFQVLRLLRRGEDLGHIAAALGVARTEVELVVRVHQLTTMLTKPATAAGGDVGLSGAPAGAPPMPSSRLTGVGMARSTAGPGLRAPLANLAAGPPLPLG